jgi:hypothetical protein
MTHDYFTYDNGVGIVPEGSFRISASQISKFLDTTTDWCREHLMGESGFAGSTATHLGTVIHAAAEMYTKERIVHRDLIESFIDSITDPEVDKSYIRSQYPAMVETLINGYLAHNVPDETELFMYKEILPGIGVGGSLDSIKYGSRPINKLGAGNRIVDYKTTSSKTAVTKFSRPYWFQQGVYVWLCKQQEIRIDYVDLVYVTTQDVNRISEVTGKPMKDYPSTTYTVTQEVTKEWLDIIESTIMMIAHSVDMWNKQPDLRWLIAKDWRLHPSAKPETKLFLN